MNTDTTPSGNDDPLCGNSVTGLFGCALGTSVPTTPAAPWQAPSPEAVALLLPQYRVEKMIGRGGMGAVYKGTQTMLNRAVAIKLLPAELSANAEFTGRFQREAQTLASLSHQGIVTIFEFGKTTEGHLYFVMEFVDGTDLSHLIHSGGIEAGHALDLTIQICEALHFAHSLGVIHRDIKPANVLVTRDGRTKLADFGLARPLTAGHTHITAASLVAGTPEYMAPEQWLGKADERADIYALGVMLYEMLTGTRPQGAFDLPSVKARVDSRLDEVVLKAMRQEPDRRYQHVSELRQAVNRIRTTHPPKAGVRRPPVPVPNPLPKRRGSAFDSAMWAVAALLLVACAYGVVVIGTNGRHREVTATPPAKESVSSAPAPMIAAAPPMAAKAVTEPVVPKPEHAHTFQPAPAMAPSSLPAQPAPVLAAMPAPLPPPQQTPAVVEPGKLDILSQQAVNAMKWSLSPLSESVPNDIRQNITLLREDLVDEGKTKPAANINTYRAAYYLCEALLAALSEREKARVAAGYGAAQAAANQVITSAELEAHRNYMMSWPQYARESDQRAELQYQSGNRVALAGEAQKVAWAARTERLQTNLDMLYRKFREALREPLAGK